ncbi:hypothetical protein MTYM_00033 [Methylococcales bacterium]|nr:hypothetical protein MTYM_00033 [Methylococcales bacterium]
MQTILKSLLWSVGFGLIMAGTVGCGHRPTLPDQKTVQSTKELPLDGLWRMTSGKANSVFRIDKGRMYFYERRKPLPKNALPSADNIKNPDIRSAADLSSHPGAVIVKDITETHDPLSYSCQSLSYDKQRHAFNFGLGEIKIISGTQIKLTTLPNSLTGLGEKYEESFWRENLDNQTWFEQTILKAEDGSRQPSISSSGKEGQATKAPQDSAMQPNNAAPESETQSNRGFQDTSTPPGKDIQQQVQQPAQTPEENPVAIKDQPSDGANQKRKVLTIPADKMESNGKLSKSAKDFIEQTLQNANASDGTVEINCPLEAPEAVVRSLVNIGVETYVDDQRNDYELVIIKP